MYLISISFICLDPFDSSLYVVGCDKISIHNNKIVKSDSVLIDLNGIAQGFSVDYIADYFYNHNGIDDFMIELGGEIRCVGDNLGKGWRIGIDKPVDAEALRQIEGLEESPDYYSVQFPNSIHEWLPPHRLEVRWNQPIGDPTQLLATQTHDSPYWHPGRRALLRSLAFQKQVLQDVLMKLKK